jgi:hypothetical protein
METARRPYVQELSGIPGIEARTAMADDKSTPDVPRAYVDLKPGFPVDAKEICKRVLQGEPHIALRVDMRVADPRTVAANVSQLGEQDLAAVARKLREVLSAAAQEARQACVFCLLLNLGDRAAGSAHAIGTPLLAACNYQDGALRLTRWE